MRRTSFDFAQAVGASGVIRLYFSAKTSCPFAQIGPKHLHQPGGFPPSESRLHRPRVGPTLMPRNAFVGAALAATALGASIGIAQEARPRAARQPSEPVIRLTLAELPSSMPTWWRGHDRSEDMPSPWRTETLWGVDFGPHFEPESEVARHAGSLSGSDQPVLDALLRDFALEGGPAWSLFDTPAGDSMTGNGLTYPGALGGFVTIAPGLAYR